MNKNDKTELFEERSVPSAVLTLSVPTVVASLVTMVYSLTDTYFVGMANDPVQTAAVTLAATVTLAFYAVTNLFGIGGSSMMSRALGRGDMKTLRESSAFSFYGALSFALLYSLLCIVLMKPLLTVLGADAATAEPTRRYLWWTVCLGSVPSIMNIVMAFLIRSEGATLHASIGSMSGCILNILLDPLFILKLNMGAEGAAVATLISNCMACLYFVFYMILKRGKTYVCVDPRAFTLRREVSLGVCNVGVPAAIQNLLNVLSHTILNNLTAPFGPAALAGMGIASKLAMIPWYVSSGISQGVMPLVGYTYAANLGKRMKKVLLFTAKLSLSVTISVTCLMCLLARPITGLFIGDEQTVSYGAVFLIGMTCSIPFISMDFLAVNVFQAMGRGIMALVMACCRKILLEIPAMLLLNRLFPLYGLACGQLAAEFFMCILGLFLLLRQLKQIPDGRPAV